MAKFDDLSNENRQLIALELSRSDLFRFKTLNSFFLDVWMALRWESVEVDLRPDEQAKCIWLMQRISDPFVAIKVKELSLASLTVPDPTSFSTLVTTLQLPFPSLRNLDISGLSQPSSCTALLRTITISTLPHTLRRLSLGAHPEAFASLVLGHAFQTLESFYMKLLDDPDGRNDSAVIAPFLLCLSSTLQQLWIYSDSKVALSPLFIALTGEPACFQNLKDFYLGDDGEVCLPYVSTLHDFLKPYQGTLDHLQLLVRDERLIEGWLAAVGDDEAPMSLQTFVIRAPDTPVTQPLLITFIRRISSTLTTLMIKGPIFNGEAVTGLIGALSESDVPSNLRTLHIETYNINVPFLDLLARKLGRLEAFRVDIIGHLEEDSFEEHLSAQGHDATYEPLHHWRLRDLKIISSSRQSRYEEICHALASAIPSLEVISFKGRKGTLQPQGGNSYIMHGDGFTYIRE